MKNRSPNCLNTSLINSPRIRAVRCDVLLGMCVACGVTTLIFDLLQYREYMYVHQIVPTYIYLYEYLDLHVHLLAKSIFAGDISLQVERDTPRKICNVWANSHRDMFNYILTTVLRLRLRYLCAVTSQFVILKQAWDGGARAIVTGVTSNWSGCDDYSVRCCVANFGTDFHRDCFPYLQLMFHQVLNFMRQHI